MIQHHGFSHRNGFLHVSVQLVGIDLVEWRFGDNFPHALKEESDTINELLNLLTWVVEDIKIGVVHKLSTHCKINNYYQDTE